ncbi:MAG: hypothetical protein EA390_06395 [Balneolaceae bacterium]|nr:MAG: hypothetical protein EA390_06395 [Balneolaceae bacterium]
MFINNVLVFIFMQRLLLHIPLILFTVALTVSINSCKSAQTSKTNNSSHIDDVYIPKDLNDSFDQLNIILKQDDIDSLRALKSEEDLWQYHFGLGLWMRNNWRLWGGSRLSTYFNDLGIYHPDDISGIIITSYWRHLNNLPLELDAQIKYYQDFWENAANPDSSLQELLPPPDSLNNEPLSLVDDNIVSKHFSSLEIVHLQTLLNFVDEEIRSATSTQSSLVCHYEEFFKRMIDQTSTTPYYLLQNFNYSSFEYILNNIPIDLINEIWEYQNFAENSDNSDSGTINEITISRTGKYSEFLKDASNKNSLIAEYNRSFQFTGVISTIMDVIVLRMNEDFKINLERERLILAVHYLTILQQNQLK